MQGHEANVVDAPQAVQLQAHSVGADVKMGPGGSINRLSHALADDHQIHLWSVLIG